MLNVVCPHNCKDCYALSVCALRAIHDEPGSVILDTKKCINCGCCATACETFGYKVLKQWKVKKKAA
jgi:Fe-S-cluster-containing hydrogenase component 2